MLFKVLFFREYLQVLLIVLFFREYLQDLVGECLEEVSQEGSFEGLIRATVEEREKKNKLQETILRWVNWLVIGYKLVVNWFFNWLLIDF